MLDIEKEIKDTKVRLCLDCGKCTVVCPVAQHNADFNPRLMIQSWLGQNSRGKQDERIWSCLNCHMCFERCNYRVQFPEFICALRAEAVSGGAQPQCTHGGAIQTLTRMMLRKDLKQERLGWLPRDIAVSLQSDTQFFVGCAPYFDVLFKDLGVKTIDGVVGALRLLNCAQIPFKLLADERCCGRDLLLQGDREGFLALAQANMIEFVSHGVKKIITACPECYYTLKIDYPKMMGNTGIEVMHLTEVLAPMLKDKRLSLGKLEKKVTYHDPCTLGRGLRVFDAPRQLLCAVSGLQLAEMEKYRETALCCGANPWVYCGAVNRQIQGERLAQAKATGADILVTVCPKCQIHLKCAQKSGDPVLDTGQVAQIEIQDLADILARSLTGGEAIG